MCHFLAPEWTSKFLFTHSSLYGNILKILWKGDKEIKNLEKKKKKMKKKRKKERVYIEAPELHDENDGIRWRW